MKKLPKSHSSIKSNGRLDSWTKNRKLIYYITCISLTVLTTLTIVLNGADCLTSPGNQQSADDRIFVVKSDSSTNQASYKKVKESFKEHFDKLTISVKENTPIGSKLADIQATDTQDSQNSKIIYAIVGGADQQSFTLRIDNNINKVELVNEVNFDYESSKKAYHVVIRALSLHLRYEVDVDIIVTDENDNKPQLDDFSIVLNNYKNNFPPYLPIGRVPATDADVNDQLRYRVLTGNNAQLLAVNETTGDILLSPWLNSNVPLRAVIEIAVSDGLNEVVRHLVLSVNLVTEVMLQNSVVVRLDGIGREEFLIKKYDTFVVTMARILGSNSMYSTNNIVVFNVEEFLRESEPHDTLTYRPYHGSSIINSTVSINVSLSARADGNDVESYLTNQYIEERIDMNRAHLSQALDVNVAQSQEDLCVQKPCQNYQECKPGYKFDKAPKIFISLANMLFRPIKAVPSFTCSCPTSSTDMKHENECCICDESKGFEGECDKNSGQCVCKPNHYQPPGSDFCLPCDCYGTGSLSLTCNQTSGLCKCRPGVVGRRCDTCATASAEVTVRGCEVIYDGCPKTFSDGIWWDKTLPDKLATQQCPPLSTGTATRLCRRTDGWQEPNLFDCISDTFKDLYTQYKFLEQKNFNLIPSTAMKMASNLRNALNETITGPSTQLYGSDMFISFRLLHHLIQYESHQTGFNLTHKQDRLFVRNIVESINYLLDPSYAQNWPEIAARSPNGGAEYLLRLIDNYGKVLIESQSDTFTQPFEISTKYFTFGLDTLSTDQLWDLTKPLTLSGTQLSPPYATDPFGPTAGTVHSIDNSSADTPLNYNLVDGPTNHLDYSLGKDSSPAIALPKYNSHQADETGTVETTKTIIPLKTLRIKTVQELFPISSLYQARSRAKRDELMIPDMKLLKQQPALVAYSVFKSLGPLLPNSHDNTVQNRFGMAVAKNSPVIWLTIRSANSSEFMNKNIQPKITYMLKMVEPVGKSRLQCAVWDFNPMSGLQGKNQTNYGIKQTGRFTTKGCEIRGIHQVQKQRFKYDYVNCSCDHIGAVTVLVDGANFDYLIGEEENVKDTTFIVGLSISIVILATILFILSCVRGHSIKSNSNSINKNLVFVLILIEVLILYSILSRSSLNQREYQCKLVAIFLHYFSISLFFWLLVNAIHFYRMLTELRDINHGPMKFYHVLSYAIPAFFVSIAVGLRIEHFGNLTFCWISIQDPIIWSMFGPISLVSVLTIILFLFALCKSLPVKEDLNGADLLKNHMLINTIKTPTIGIYWIVTVYVVNEELFDNVYVFPTLTIIKSIILFVILCIIDKHIRYNLYVSWLRFKGEKVPFIEESLNYSSTQWMPPAMGEDGTLGKQGYGYGGYVNHVSTPGFQSSCTDIFRPDVLSFSAASTTSRSSATRTSSSVYQYNQHRIKDGPKDDGYGRTGKKHSRRHKRKHRHHRHHHHHHHHHHKHQKSRHHEDDYELYDNRRRHGTQQMPNEKITANNELASSHSSDGDDISSLPKRDQDFGQINEGASTSNTNVSKKDNNDVDDDAAVIHVEEQQTLPMELAMPKEEVQERSVDGPEVTDNQTTVQSEPKEV